MPATLFFPFYNQQQNTYIPYAPIADEAQRLDYLNRQLYRQSPVSTAVYPYEEKTVPKEDRGITNDNLYDRLRSFRVAFEGFSSGIKDTQNTGDPNKSPVLGYGMTFYINKDGSTRDFKEGETITKEDALEQLDRYDRIYAPKELKKIGLTNFDKYPAELKFQLMEAMFNMRGTDSIIHKSGRDRRTSNYYNALLEYEKNKGWENPDYDYNQIFKHADWNGTTNGWIQLRSFMRQQPQYINWNDVNKNDYYKSPTVNGRIPLLDSLLSVYKPNF